MLSSGFSNGSAYVFFIYFIMFLPVIVLETVAMWKIFSKAGERGWKVLVPVYNTYVLFKIAWKRSVFFLLIAISALAAALCMAIGLFENADTQAVLAVAGVVLALAAFFVNIGLQLNLSRSFGHGVGFALGLIFVNTVFVLILGLGKARYVRKTADEKSL